MKNMKQMKTGINEGSKMTIETDRSRQEQEKQFSNYIGSTVTDDCQCNREIRKLIKLAKEAFNNNEYGGVV